MKCKHYYEKTEVIGSPSDEMIAGPDRIHKYAHCHLYHHRCNTCNGDITKCSHVDRAIEAKRRSTTGTNREWINSLTNEELAKLIESDYFQDIIKHPLKSLDYWFEKTTFESEEYMKELW